MVAMHYIAMQVSQDDITAVLPSCSKTHVRNLWGVIHMLKQVYAFWCDQRRERDSGPCTCETAMGYLQITCARHPTNRSLTMYEIWAQSVQPFSISGTVTLHVRTAHVQGRSRLILASHPTNRSPSIYQVWARSVQPYSRYETTVALHVGTCSRTPTVTHGDALPGGCLHACEVSA